MNDYYELLDSGSGRRLERFGEIVIDRAAPQATWKKSLDRDIWNRADAKFIREKSDIRWKFRSEIPKEFPFTWNDITFELRFSENGQIGIFTEQMDNWKWLKETIASADRELSIVNGFSYTGGSTIAASLGGKDGKGADVTHLDAAKSAVNWARKNAELSGLKDETIRFVVEDVMHFFERQIKRGRKYHGIILDPPAFGRAGNKKWILKRDLPTLIEYISQLLDDDAAFLLFTCHDPDITTEMLRDEISQISCVKKSDVELLRLTIPSEVGNSLPNGIGVRWRKQ